MLCMMQVCVVLDRQSVCVEALPGTMSVFLFPCSKLHETQLLHINVQQSCTLALVQCS